MRKIFKWSFFSVLAAIGVGLLLFGRSLGSYAKTAYNEVRNAAQKNVPIEFQMKRAKTLIREIDPELKDAKREVARAEVELGTMRRSIEDLRVATARDYDRIQRQREYLANEDQNVAPVSYEIRTMRTRVRHDLERTFDVYKTNVEILKSKEMQVERQEKIVEAARNKLHAVRSERQKLEDMVLRLSARKRQLDALATTVPNSDLDTSSLAEARKVLDSIKKELDINEKLIKEELFMATGQDIEPEENRDVVSEIDHYFGGSHGSKASKDDADFVPIKALRAAK